MRPTILLLALLCCGCSTVSKAEALIGSLASKVDELGPAVTTAAATAKAASEGVAALRAKSEAAAEKALADLAAKGAPVDGSAGDLAKWTASNPVEAVGSGGALLTALAALAAGYRRKARALAVVVKGVEDAPPEAREATKAAIRGAGGDAVRDVIRAAKRSVT